MLSPSRGVLHLLSPAGAADAINTLQRYFEPHPAGKFSGAHFEGLGGGGDRRAVADEFTAEDLVAVSMLAVTVVDKAALEILVVRRLRLGEILRRIPTAVELSSLEPSEVGPAWPVRELYRELTEIDQIGETTATKLIARKRPQLVPILDSVVSKELGVVRGQLWKPLHEWLRQDDGALQLHLCSLRTASGLEPGISALRVFDVLSWMSGKGYATLQDFSV